MFEGRCKRLNFLACANWLNYIGAECFDDGPRFTCAIDDNNRIETSTPERMVDPNGFTESNEVTLLD